MVGCKPPNASECPEKCVNTGTWNYFDGNQGEYISDVNKTLSLICYGKIKTTNVATLSAKILDSITVFCANKSNKNRYFSADEPTDITASLTSSSLLTIILVASICVLLCISAAILFYFRKKCYTRCNSRLQGKNSSFEDENGYMEGKNIHNFLKTDFRKLSIIIAISF